MESAREKPDVVREYLMKECSEGRVLGPLDPSQYPAIQVSRFGVIPKGSSGKWRLIVDLSAPEGHSVNDGIRGEWCSLTYVSVDDAVEAVRQRGPGTMLAKVDIRSAYRIVPVHPEDRLLLGMMWEQALYVDTALPFGLRSAPKIFNAVADALEWIARSRGVSSMFHYLDDFLVVGAPMSTECAEHLTILLATFKELGVPVAAEKLEGPATRLVFLGIEIDTEEMVVRLPLDKLLELKVLVGKWLSRKSCGRQELQSLAGKLQHASKVVRPGRTFLRRVFEMLSVTGKKYHHIRLNVAFRSDIAWWHMFLEEWNGVAMMPGVVGVEPSVEVYTDASGSIGCGAWWAPHWLQLKWSLLEQSEGRSFGDQPITQKEVLPVVLACAVWGSSWKNRRVVVHCDNEAAVTVLNSGYARDSQIMHLLRALFFIKAVYQIELKATHIPGKDNVIADAISRDKLTVLHSQVPPPDPDPTQVPREIQHLLVEGQPDWTSVNWTQLFRRCFRQDWPSQHCGHTDQRARATANSAWSRT